MLANEVRERRQNEKASKRPLHVDAQRSLGLRSPKSTFDFIEIGQKPDASTVIDIAVVRRPNRPRRALEQARAKVRL